MSEKGPTATTTEYSKILPLPFVPHSSLAQEKVLVLDMTAQLRGSHHTLLTTLGPVREESTSRITS